MPFHFQFLWFSHFLSGVLCFFFIFDALQEVHVLHDFTADFYSAPMAISILGYIRPEYDYVSVESLIEDINEDIEVTKRSLDRGQWREALDDSYLWEGLGDDEQEVDADEGKEA